jgi:hypothetical protein
MRSGDGLLTYPSCLDVTCRACLLAVTLFIIPILAVSGCSTVAPYERERLARPDMIAGRDADARAGQDHATAYREGSTGALGSTGGGCGCN